MNPSPPVTISSFSACHGIAARAGAGPSPVGQDGCVRAHGPEMASSGSDHSIPLAGAGDSGRRHLVYDLAGSGSSVQKPWQSRGRVELQAVVAAEHGWWRSGEAWLPRRIRRRRPKCAGDDPHQLFFCPPCANRRHLEVSAPRSSASRAGDCLSCQQSASCRPPASLPAPGLAEGAAGGFKIPGRRYTKKKADLGQALVADLEHVRMIAFRDRLVALS